MVSMLRHYMDLPALSGTAVVAFRTGNPRPECPRVQLISSCERQSRPNLAHQPAAPNTPPAMDIAAPKRHSVAAGNPHSSPVNPGSAVWSGPGLLFLIHGQRKIR